HNGFSWSWGTEARATVHPKDFSYPVSNPDHGLKLARDWENKTWFGNGPSPDSQDSFNENIPPGNDTSGPDLRVDTPSKNGVIFDLDAPGFDFIVAPQGTIFRFRANFKSFASITVGGVAVRASKVRDYFIRFSLKQTEGPQGVNWVILDPPDVKKDNQ